jgi:hypothetical protein
VGYLPGYATMFENPSAPGSARRVYFNYVNSIFSSNHVFFPHNIAEPLNRKTIEVFKGLGLKPHMMNAGTIYLNQGGGIRCVSNVKR